MKEEVLITAIVFTGFYYILKMFADYLLKRRIVKGGHIDKVNIINSVPPQEKEPQRMITLKWALVSTMAGAGFVVAYIVGIYYKLSPHALEGSMISFGIELMFIGLGFLFYFLIATQQKNK